MKTGRGWLWWAAGGFVVLLLALVRWQAGLEAVKFGFGTSHPDRVKVTYWEKWTGFEKDGMEAIVNEFNASQNRIWVDYISVSNVNSKTLVATAGGRPPDVAGLWDSDTVVFADKNALTPLDEMFRSVGLTPDHYIPVYWDMCTYRDHVWALPSTPATTALHWNKKMFRAAGLDPEKPPRTFEELDEMSAKLTITDKATGQIRQMGFLPPEPGWWHYGWGSFWGGKLWDGKQTITIDTPPYLEAFNWIQSYSSAYGVAALQTFRSSFGNFSSPQNPFMSQQVAMVLQGVWMANYVFQFSPTLEWGAAPFPVVHKGDAPVTFAGCDMLVIPRGAKHPREAFEFMAYVQRQGPMERLCLSHRKNSPLRAVSDSFYRLHKNPYIRMFQQLAWSKNAVHQPKMSVWNEYGNEITNAFDRVWLKQQQPKEALATVKRRVQQALDRVNQLHDTAPSRWLKIAPFAVAALIMLAVVGVALLREIRIHRQVGGLPARRLVQQLVTGLTFASPWLIGLSVFILYPVAASVIYSFCDYSVLSEPRWVGMMNFHDIASDDVFWGDLRNTALYAGIALPCGVALAIGVALLLDTRVKGMGVYRTLYFLPSVTPLVASVMVWIWIFNSQFGVLNYVIGKLTFGYIPPIPWLSDSHYAMAALILMSFWGIGHTVVILLAALQDVPVSLYEAADLDGASAWSKIWHVTLPMVSPVIYFNVVMGIIGALQVFVVPFIMTGGGPARSTEFYSMYLYTNAFLYLKMGYASAMAWILFILILVLTFVAVRASKSRVHYMGG